MSLLKTPSISFAEVRDGRRSLPLWLDVDLSAARSVALGNALTINIAGNSFYIDADTENGGNAVVHFQDTNLDRAAAPFFVSPGFIANVPFTQILIENASQAKRLRIFYGVDVDFQAGVNASIAIAGRVDVNDIVGPSCQVIWPTLPTAVGTHVTLFLDPLNNPSGAIIRELHMSVAPSTVAGSAFNALFASPTAPVALASKPNSICLGYVGQNASPAYVYISKHLNARIPAGWGIWALNSNQAVIGYSTTSLSLEIL